MILELEFIIAQLYEVSKYIFCTISKYIPSIYIFIIQNTGRYEY